MSHARRLAPAWFALLALPAVSFAVASKEGNAERMVYDRIDREEKRAAGEETADVVLQRQKDAAAEAEAVRSLSIRDIMKIPPSEAALAAEAEAQEAEGGPKEGKPATSSGGAVHYLIAGLGATLLLCITGVLLVGGRKKA